MPTIRGSRSESTRSSVRSIISIFQSMGSTPNRRTVNYSVDEDTLIVSAWLNLSLDAVEVNGCKPKSYRSRMSDFFHKHKKFKSSRNEVSIEHRWAKIQASTKSFCECLAKMESKSEDGADEQDKISQAKVLYRQLYKSAFRYDHCWSLLRHHPKWLGEETKPKRYRIATDVDSSPSTPETLINLGEGDVSHDNYLESETTLDTKAGKDQPNKRKSEDNYVDLETPLDIKAKKVQEDDIVAFVQESAELKKQVNEKKAEWDDKIYLQEQARLVYEQEKLRTEQLKDEERIMSIDTNGMPPLQAEYYKRRQMKILAKMIEY